MHKPELLILDEPSSGLDPLMQHEFENLLRETTDEGRTGLRRTAPQKMEIRFRHPVSPAAFKELTGVIVTESAGRRMTLDVTGEIGPILAVIASHDPVALTARPADLDELFLDFYKQPPKQEVSHAG